MDQDGAAILFQPPRSIRSTGASLTEAVAAHWFRSLTIFGAAASLLRLPARRRPVPREQIDELSLLAAASSVDAPLLQFFSDLVRAHCRNLRSFHGVPRVYKMTRYQLLLGAVYPGISVSVESANRGSIRIYPWVKFENSTLTITSRGIPRL